MKQKLIQLGIAFFVIFTVASIVKSIFGDGEKEPDRYEASNHTSYDEENSENDTTAQSSDTNDLAALLYEISDEAKNKEHIKDCFSCDNGVCEKYNGSGLDPCGLCDNTGICTLCDGNGDGIGNHPCVRCEENGKCPYDDDPCSYCKGSGECHICDGEGTRIVSNSSNHSSNYGDSYYNDYDYSYDSSINSKTICPSCGGGGRKTCTSCGGLGYFSFKKRSPNYGSGSYSYYEKKDCYCSGGSVPCTRCGGLGYY